MKRRIEADHILAGGLAVVAGACFLTGAVAEANVSQGALTPQPEIVQGKVEMVPPDWGPVVLDDEAKTLGVFGVIFLAAGAVVLIKRPLR
jgi:hypothetical protein